MNLLAERLARFVKQFELWQRSQGFLLLHAASRQVRDSYCAGQVSIFLCVLPSRGAEVVMEELYLQDVFLEFVPIAEMHREALFVTPDAIIEVLELAPDEESVYAFELREGSVLSFGVTGDRILDLMLCRFEDYESWLDSVDEEAELLTLDTSLGVRSASLAFRAARSMHVAVVVSNSSNLLLQALVEARS